MNRFGAMLCIVAAIGVQVSAHSQHWRSGSLGDAGVRLDFHVGLQAMELCVVLGARTDCEQLSLNEAAARSELRGVARLAVTASTVTWLLSFLTTLMLVMAPAFMHRTGDPRAGRWSAYAVALYLLGSFFVAATWSGVDSSLGWSFYLALGMSLLGIFGSGYLMIPEEDYGDAVLAHALEVAAADARARAVANAGQAPDGPKDVITGDHGAAARDATRFSLDAERRATSVDTTAAVLRFVAREARIDEAGVEAVGPDGQAVRLEWRAIRTVAARMLPPDPPFEGRSFVDLAAESGAPIRLLPTTRVNYAALPGGAGHTSTENFRKLVKVALERARLRPEAPEVGFLGGRKPQRFQSVKGFREWDQRYG